MTETVEYKTIDRFPGYRFGSDGAIWSRAQPQVAAAHGGWRKLRCHLIQKTGYLKVKIFRKWYRAHRLILEAFRGPCPEGMEALHGPDPTRSNNAIANLRWGTRQENVNECVAQGRFRGGCIGGLASGRAKISPDDVLAIKALRQDGVAHDEIARRFGIGARHSRKIVSGERWKHVVAEKAVS